MKFDDVIGQNADMFDLQRVMMRSSKKMTNQQQQNQTRWCVRRGSGCLIPPCRACAVGVQERTAVPAPRGACPLARSPTLVARARCVQGVLPGGDAAAPLLCRVRGAAGGHGGGRLCDRVHQGH